MWGCGAKSVQAALIFDPAGRDPQWQVASFFFQAISVSMWYRTPMLHWRTWFLRERNAEYWLCIKQLLLACTDLKIVLFRCADLGCQEIQIHQSHAIRSKDFQFLSLTPPKIEEHIHLMAWNEVWDPVLWILPIHVVEKVFIPLVLIIGHSAHKIFDFTLFPLGWLLIR